jgi:thiosulfate/3-mercaptopyruvate sulfurtransferase
MASLMSVEALCASLGEVPLLDVRWRVGRTDGREQYVAGHIPSAAYVDVETDLAQPAADPVDVHWSPART